HLSGVDLPTFWVSGTRDALADPGLLRSTVASLGGRATLHEIADADHGFGVPRRSGRTGEDVWGEVARAVSAWVEATFGF
ncbi:MAG: alpha/beta hydrolase, partial [Gemmatimonadota bacterium]|nr:alpha/beta hydrolase [Gemmatimonadota bacterium]